MADIKVRDVAKKTVKAIDKSAIATERFKDTIVHTKERAENATNEDGNINAVMDDLDIFLLTLAERYRPTKNQ